MKKSEKKFFWEEWRIYKFFRPFLSQKKNKKGLNFYQMGGNGLIMCENCGFHQKLISFIHGFPTNNSWTISGYQCQKCGEFHEIKNDNKYKKPIICDCGGILSRDNELFCPHCKNTDLKYWIKYLT